MPEVMFSGPDGRLEGKYHHSKQPNAPIALVLHPHPQHGGTMNHKVVFTLFHVFANLGFSVLRFNTRGVGRSQGVFDNGTGELSDAAAALDWLQQFNPDAQACWIGGYSFGAWIGMQLLMRRPEIDGFVSVAPPANLYDFGFLAPCPSSGLIVYGDKDEVVPPADIQKLVTKLSQQKGITVDAKVVRGANHFFGEAYDKLAVEVHRYVSRAMTTPSPAPEVPAKPAAIAGSAPQKPVPTTPASTPAAGQAPVAKQVVAKPAAAAKPKAKAKR